MEAVLGNRDLFQEIAGMFIENCSDFIAKIKEGITGNDADIIEREAQRLKGDVGNFYAKEANAKMKVHDYHLDSISKSRRAHQNPYRQHHLLSMEAESQRFLK